MTGRTCAGTLVTGTGSDGAPRAVYLHHIADNEQTMREDGAQAVVWQTAINPVVALELLAEGTGSGAGVLGPEAFDVAPFLALLADYDAPHGCEERDPADPLRRTQARRRPSAAARRLALGGDARHRLAAARGSPSPSGRSSDGPSGPGSGSPSGIPLGASSRSPRSARFMPGRYPWRASREPRRGIVRRHGPCRDVPDGLRLRG